MIVTSLDSHKATSTQLTPKAPPLNMEDIPVTMPTPLYPFARLFPSPHDLEHASTSPTASCPLLDLPLELRNKIYRYLVISHIDCKSHPRLWRPLSVDGGRWRIGYFPRHTVIPLLLVCRKIHDEAAAVLYGENTFAFHISGLADGPIAFLEWLSPVYVRLLRRVYVRTGYDVDTYGFRNRFDGHGVGEDGGKAVELTAEQKRIREVCGLALSVRLMKQAWPVGYGVVVNRDEVAIYQETVDWEVGRKRKVNEWPVGGYHLWKMFVRKDEKEEVRREFKRIEWRWYKGKDREEG